MSVLGYFGRRRGELRMPKKVDPLGIRFAGPVLTGKMSVELALQQQEIPMENYEDPVLRAHCRLEKEG